jgi:hypothetical protein
MNSAYDIFQKTTASNKQIYTLLRFACRCNHVTALTMNTYESAAAFLAAQCHTSKILNLGPVDEKVTEVYTTIAKELEVKFNIDQLRDNFESTELLYINTPAEGNYRAMELGKYAEFVSKYIIMPNTVAFAHQASPSIKLADNIQPIGMVFGINHFLQHNDDWFILEHDDLDPGMTVLVNRKNVSNAYS